jgi:hypothetical protein
MKINPVVAELFHADRRTDMRKLTVAFRNFANAPVKRKQSTLIPSGLIVQHHGLQNTLENSFLAVLAGDSNSGLPC